MVIFYCSWLLFPFVRKMLFLELLWLSNYLYKLLWYRLLKVGKKKTQFWKMGKIFFSVQNAKHYCMNKKLCALRFQANDMKNIYKKHNTIILLLSFHNTSSGIHIAWCTTCASRIEFVEQTLLIYSIL